MSMPLTLEQLVQLDEIIVAQSAYEDALRQKQRVAIDAWEHLTAKEILPQGLPRKDRLRLLNSLFLPSDFDFKNNFGAELVGGPEKLDALRKEAAEHSELVALGKAFDSASQATTERVIIASELRGNFQRMHPGISVEKEIDAILAGHLVPPPKPAAAFKEVKTAGNLSNRVKNWVSDQTARLFGKPAEAAGTLNPRTSPSPKPAVAEIDVMAAAQRERAHWLSSWRERRSTAKAAEKMATAASHSHGEAGAIAATVAALGVGGWVAYEAIRSTANSNQRQL